MDCRNSQNLNQDVFLYHGSRGGIHGAISPCSREHCDFGRGFYLGDNPMQTKGIIVSDQLPCWYEVQFRLSEIPDDKKIYISGMEWLYTVLAYRNRVPEFSKLDHIQELKAKYEQYDVIVGPIADDRMNTAIRRFEEDALIDVALMHCLSYVQYGTQYALKTPEACSKVDILNSHVLDDNEIDQIACYAEDKREEGHDIVREMGKQFRTQGHVLSEIVSHFEGGQHSANGFCLGGEYDER